MMMPTAASANADMAQMPRLRRRRLAGAAPVVIGGVDGPVGVVGVVGVGVGGPIASSSRRTFAAISERCRSSGGVTASIQCDDDRKYSISAEGTASAIRMGRIAIARLTARSTSRWTCGDAFAA